MRRHDQRGTGMVTSYCAPISRFLPHPDWCEEDDGTLESRLLQLVPSHMGGKSISFMNFNFQLQVDGGSFSASTDC